MPALNLSEDDYARLWQEVDTPNEDMEELAMNGKLSWKDVEKYAEDMGSRKDWNEFPERVKKPLRKLIIDYVKNGIVK